MATDIDNPSIFHSTINYTNPTALSSYPDVTIITTQDDPDNPAFTATMSTNRAVLSAISPVLKPVLAQLDPLEDLTILTDLTPRETQAFLRFCTHGEISLLASPTTFKLFGIDVQSLPVEQVKVEKWPEIEVLTRVKQEDFGSEEVFEKYVGDVEADVKIDTTGENLGDFDSNDAEADQEYLPKIAKRKKKKVVKRKGDFIGHSLDFESKRPKKSKKAEYHYLDEEMEEDEFEGIDDDFIDDKDIDDDNMTKNIWNDNERVVLLTEYDEKGNEVHVKKMKRRNPVTNEWGAYIKLEMTEEECTMWKSRRNNLRKNLHKSKAKRFFWINKERESERKYQCDKCNYGADTKWDMREHTLRHDRDEVYFCFICEAGFCQVKSLQSHMRNVHKDEIPCKYCGQKFTRNGNLLTHLQSHEEGTWKPKIFQCVHCGKELRDRPALAKHYQNEGPFHGKTCIQCPQSTIEFETHLEHKAHLDLMHGGRFLYVCGICDEVFENSVFKKRHRDEVHVRREKKACPVCGDLFSDVGRHMLSIHKIGEGFRCDECGSMQRNEGALQKHKLTNHGQFLCEMCPYVSKEKAKLKLHILNIHTKDEDKPFHCTTCGKGLATLQRLRQHEITHTSLRPHKCDFCGKDFNDKSNLTSHLKTVHFGLKRSDKLPKMPKIN